MTFILRASVAIATVLSASAAVAAPTDAQLCIAAKEKSLSKYELCVWKAQAKAAQLGTAVDATLCQSKFEEAWTKRNVERNWRTLDVVDEISEETGKSYAQISLNWLLMQEGVTAPIIGARRLEQLEDNLGAAGWQLSDEQVARLSEASAIEDVYPYRFIREMQRV